MGEAKIMRLAGRSTRPMQLLGAHHRLHLPVARGASTERIPSHVTTVDGVDVIDAEAWWRSVHHLPVRAKLRGLLQGAGVSFWDGDTTSNFVKGPAVALSAIGGIPLRVNEHTPRGSVELAIGRRAQWCHWMMSQVLYA